MRAGLAGPRRGTVVQFRGIGLSTTLRSYQTMKIRSLYKAALTVGFALLATAAAQAQTYGTASTDLWSTDFQKAFMTEKMMHMMDMSHKGMVTRADYDQYMGKVFDMLDKGHKGMLDKHAFLTDEAAAGSNNLWTPDFLKTLRSEHMMHMMDKGGKGMVTKAEFMEHMGKIFVMLDKNHDGMLEADEFMYDKAFGVK
jgi:Ca2+-binding EF-hand superfamily protein